ncbi:MAG: hypothetical protein ABI367_08190 [Mucilaginibacter sp.]
MKKLVLVCFFALVASASFAQGRPQQTPAQQLERLKTQVTGITADQETKITAIYAAQGKTRDSLMAAANGDFQSVMPAFQAMRTSGNAKIKAVLTADQQKQFDAIPQRGPGGGAPRN